MNEPEATPNPQVPDEAVTSSTPPAKKEARRWKPLSEEFFLDDEFAQLVVELGEDACGPVMFEIQPEAKDGQPGHVLIASVLS